MVLQSKSSSINSCFQEHFPSFKIQQTQITVTVQASRASFLTKVKYLTSKVTRVLMQWWKKE